MKLNSYKFILIILITSSFAFSQTVVVNKYFNSGLANGVGDIVELLLIQNNLDMRGMIIKDFSSSMASDGGGKYEFKQVSLWQSLPAGTLVILRNDSSATDINPSDYVLDLGLKNPTYFINRGGTFDIATTEMVMIKSASSDTTGAGVTGSIHVLAGGVAGTQFTAAPEPKLRATGTSPGGKYIFAKNSTSSITDFNGTDADSTSTTLTWGQGNNATNTTYINSLRGGITPNTTVQFTSSGTTVQRNAGTIQINVSITNPSSTNATTVQSALTGGTGVNGVDIQNYTTQTLNFPAGSSANKSFNVTIINYNQTEDKTLIFSLQNPSGGTNAGLGTPSTFTLTIRGVQVDTTTPIPISNLRMNNANGVPIDSGKVFTITGVVTVGNEFNSPSYLQDNTAGIAVYARGTGLFSASVKVGDSVKVRGKLSHFRGLTQFDSIAFYSILDSNKIVTPSVVTITDINNQAWDGFEAIEGKLIKINEVSTLATGAWAGNTNYTIFKGNDSLTLRVTSGTSIIGSAIPTNPFNVIGALGQFKSTAPYNSGYQILVRYPSDIEPVTSVDEGKASVVKEFRLYQNYPNPFNPNTTIQFDLPKSEFIELSLYNLLGEKVAELATGFYKAGTQKIIWNAEKFSSGIYFYRLKAGSFVSIKKLILMK